MEEQQAAPAPAEQEPIEQPSEDQTQEQVTDEGQDEPKPKRSRSAREALEKAFAGGSETKPTEEEKAAAEAKAAEKDKPEAKSKEPGKDEAKAPQRAPDGKFAAKDADKAAEKPQDGQEAKPEAKGKADHNAPPSRFSTDAKAAWEKAPEQVRAEVYRMQRELEKGIAQKDEVLKPLEPFVKMAKESGTTVHQALQNYVQMENALRQNPQQGLSMLAQNLGMTPQQMGQMLLGQQPGKADPRDQQIMGLQQQIRQMQQQFGQVSQTVKQQQYHSAVSEIEKFASEKGPDGQKLRPHFDDLAEDMIVLLNNDRSLPLHDAYEQALQRAQAVAQKFAAPQPAPEPAPPPAPPAQTRQARSLTGAPSPGSNPTTQRTPSKSAREALARAFRA